METTKTLYSPSKAAEPESPLGEVRALGDDSGAGSQRAQPGTGYRGSKSEL